MIEKNLLTTHGKLRLKIPSQLSEITLGQMMALQAKKELRDLDAISILSGTPLASLQQINNGSELMQFADTIIGLSQQIKYLYNAEAIPKEITLTVDGKMVTVKVTRNLAMEPAGAFMAAREIIGEEISSHIEQYGEDNWQKNFNPSLEACCKILAQYLYCRATGLPYDEYKAAEFTENIEQLRVTEALPIARHFFISYPNWSTRKTSFLHRVCRPWRNGRAYKPSRSLNTSTL
ncbi:hypothetical protein D0C36_22075 [Mucilaginibacter conchicola]|uniref:Uncharacterized protein n=1 Tax=Mucilaginibacter conchicola TaxID=2303333 RepID=A0A372NNH6_9SPHI|nr:hypothetical protein [Mucilaginibacter conchicola]RFZ90474.1 hypothetical protein D0C36_22075 [Mucilaginibacter conchicola]